jgi:hypothetical protein
MSSFFSSNFLDLPDCSTNFLGNIEFGAFNFGGDFYFFADDSDDTIGTGSYKYDRVLYDYSVEGSVHIRLCRHNCKRRPNRCILNKSVKSLCWYINFFKLGETRELTHLMSTNQYGDFRHWFWIPLKKVESLAEIFIEHGYIVSSRRAWC